MTGFLGIQKGPRHKGKNRAKTPSAQQMKKIFPVFLLFSLSVHAQEKKNIVLVRSGDSLKPFARDTTYVAQRDLYDIAKSIFVKKKTSGKKNDTAFVKPVI